MDFCRLLKRLQRCYPLIQIINLRLRYLFNIVTEPLLSSLNPLNLLIDFAYFLSARSCSHDIKGLLCIHLLVICSGRVGHSLGLRAGDSGRVHAKSSRAPHFLFVLGQSVRLTWLNVDW